MEKVNERTTSEVAELSISPSDMIGGPLNCGRRCDHVLTLGSGVCATSGYFIQQFVLISIGVRLYVPHRSLTELLVHWSEQGHGALLGSYLYIHYYS